MPQRDCEPLKNREITTYPYSVPYRSSGMTFKNPLRVVLLLALVACAVANSVSASNFHTIRIAWDPVFDDEIMIYTVYMGIASGQYTQVFDAGKYTELSIPNMIYGETYYIAVTAAGSSGLESPYSDEITVTVLPPPLPASCEISMSISGNPELCWSFPVSALNSFPEFIIQASPDLINWAMVDTVFPEQATGGSEETLQFSWPIPMSGSQRFYRLTAENWVGSPREP